MFDLFNKNEIKELEIKLSLANKQIESLKSDVRILEEVKSELELELGKTSKVSAKVPTKNSQPKIEKKHGQTSRTASLDVGQNEAPTLAASVALGLGIGATLVDDSTDSSSSSES